MEFWYPGRAGRVGLSPPPLALTAETSRLALLSNPDQADIGSRELHAEREIGPDRQGVMNREAPGGRKQEAGKEARHG